TCLVGKNESGKTSILHALAKINSVDDALAKFDKDRDCPRRMFTDLDPKTVALETTWSLGEEDLAAIAEVLGPGSFTQKTITISRTYANSGTWSIHTNQKKVVEWLLSQSQCEKGELLQLETASTVVELLAKAEPLKAASPRITAMLAKVAKWRKSDPD